MKKEIKQMINEIKEINLDNYSYSEKKYNTVIYYSFELLDYNYSIMIVVFDDPNKEHFIDVEIYIGGNKVKGLVIHNEHQVKNLKDFLTFLLWP